MKKVMLLALAIGAISANLSATTLLGGSQQTTTTITVSTSDAPDTPINSKKIPPALV